MKKTMILTALAALSATLCAETPAELEKTFDEAVKSGRPLTAERMFTQLLEKGGKLAPIRYYQAAEVSRELGKSDDRVTRLSHFLKEEQKWTPEVEHAAWILCREAANADAFVRIAANKPVPLSLHWQGLMLLERYTREKRAADFKKVAEALLEAFPDPKLRNDTFRRVADMALANVPGFAVADAKSLIERFPSSNMNGIERLLAARGGDFPPMWRLRFCVKAKMLLDPSSFESIAQAASSKDEAVLDELAKGCRELEKLACDGEHPRHAATLYRVRGMLKDRYYGKDKAAEGSADLLARFDAIAGGKVKLPDDQMRNLAAFSADAGRLTAADAAKLRNKYPNFVPTNYMGQFGIVEACRAAKSSKPYKDFMAKYPSHMRAEARYQMLRVLAEVKDVAEVKAGFEERLFRLSNAGVDFNHLSYAMAETGLSDKDLAAYLAALYKRTGSLGYWDWFQRENWAGRRVAAFTGDAVTAFRKTIAKDVKPGERMFAIAREINGLGRGAGNIAPPRAHELFAEACKLYPGLYPVEGRWDNPVFEAIRAKYMDLCQYHPESAATCAKAMIAKLDPKSKCFWEAGITGNIFWNLRNNPAVASEVAFARVRATGNMDYLGGVYFPETLDKLPLDRNLVVNSGAKTFSVVDANWVVNDASKRRITPELAADMLAIGMPKRDWANTAEDWNSRFFQTAISVVRTNPKLFEKFPFAELAAKILDTKGVSENLKRNFLVFATAAGRGQEFLDRYVKSFAADAAPRKVSLLSALLSNADITPFPSKDRKADVFGDLLVKEYLPALKATPDRAAPRADLGYSGLVVSRFFEWRKLAEAKARPDYASTYAPTITECVRLKLAGASGWDDRDRSVGGSFYNNDYRIALNATNAVALAAVARTAGYYSNSWWLGRDATEKLLKDTRAAGLWEPLYLLVSTLNDQDKGINALLVECRAETSKRLPGVYPVSERDPLYPLYMAADELSKNNVEKATSLLMKNLTAFERDAIRLPPDFVAWAVDQMRLARGNNDELLVKARALASRLLEDESRLPAELAASLLLTRAECYRDQQNFEVAKLEYQTIRNNPAYAKTKAARKAMFRSIDLMIDTGNASGVESTLEYWLSQPDAEIQAQAHYFLARIAFDRKDYEECRKQLKEVFSIDYTHTDGRFLEGRWKLATGNEVDDTDVLIGSLSDRTMIRPGQQLAITVQDRNLSVAGGGASIPVVITTKPGGDREKIYLYPTPRDPTLFRGVIDVKLGEAAVSNLTLEVIGDDTATYTIEPEYLKARGLPVTESKVLRVVDDARLAIGAGSPRDEEGETEKALERMVDSGVESRELARSLRPGNPLYVAVMDKDRSRKGEGEVTVSLSTTSGDRLDAVRLKEVRPYSGIFRGVVPTCLPPPRAHASDTAIGYNPGDVISTRRDGGWKSLADGKPGKWIEVDTMASHEFSNIVFRTSNPEALRAVSLSGRLSGGDVLLGSFPAPSAKGRAGLRRWVDWRNGMRTEQAIRDFYRSMQAPKPTAVTNVMVNATARNNAPCVAYVSGGFKAPADVSVLRFRIVPRATGGDTFRRLWLSVMVDGREVYSGYGATIANRIVTCEITPKCHLLEVFSVQYGAADAWELCWEPADGETQPVPAAWFDDTANPELEEFLADKVSIVRVPEGFSATFREPIRLRSFRLSVVDRVGPDASLDKITATDWSGNEILPVESDFSEVQRNDRLEVAPGDRISATYVDETTSSGLKRVLTKTVSSSFNNASVGFYFEEVHVTSYGSQSHLNTAYRFVPGDTLLVAVFDPDQDLTDEADKVNVKIVSDSGTEREITLAEQNKSYGGIPWHSPDDVSGVHSGFFLGLLKTAPAGNTNAAARAAFPVTADDALTASYDDRENTTPGIPFVRTAKVVSAREEPPVLTLYQTAAKRVVDTSHGAEIRLAALRRRAGNDKVTTLYRDVYSATPMPQEVCDSTNLIPVNAAAPLPIRVVEPSRARHRDSYLVLSAVADSELKRAEADGDDPQVKKMHLGLGAGFDMPGFPVNIARGGQSFDEARKAGSFNGSMRFAVGGIDSKGDQEYRAGHDGEDGPIVLPVNGSDTVTITVTDSKGVELAKRRLELVSDAAFSLVDSSWSAERTAAHVGEKFYLRIDDADRDVSEEPDNVEVDVATTGGTVRKVVLTETLPHSGVFTGTVRPTIFVPGETIPEVTTGAEESVEMLLSDDRIPVKFGEKLTMTYRDERVLPGTDPRTLAATGTVYKGADGSIRLFSKRFRDVDSAVLVQFRLAECLFEQAKDYRKLRQNEKSSEAIAKGRAILEEALKNNPESAHVAQGEFLLANLYQELAAEEEVQAKSLRKEGETEAAEEAEKKSRLLYAEALARFSSILAVWPEGDYAPRAQYHKAYCLEMLKEYKLAGEEYVKMTYMYPESDLVGDATIRLATYYYKEEKKYETAARIYGSFARRFPNHDKAARALFMCGSCYIKEGEAIVKRAEAAAMKEAEKRGSAFTGLRGVPLAAAECFTHAVNSFVDMTEKYAATTTPELRAQGLYWAGDASLRKDDAKAAYIFLKRTVLEYPETEWARRARGLMLQNGKAFKDLD